jgi:hypothetical protein
MTNVYIIVSSLDTENLLIYDTQKAAERYLAEEFERSWTEAMADSGDPNTPVFGWRAVYREQGKEQSYRTFMDVEIWQFPVLSYGD